MTVNRNPKRLRKYAVTTNTDNQLNFINNLGQKTPVFNRLQGNINADRKNLERERLNFPGLQVQPTQSQLSLAKHHDLASAKAFQSSGGLYGADPNNPNQARKVNPSALSPSSYSAGEFLLGMLSTALPFIGGPVGAAAQLAKTFLTASDLAGVTDTKSFVNKISGLNLPPTMFESAVEGFKRGDFDPSSPNFGGNLQAFNNQLKGVGQLPDSFKQENIYDLAQVQDKRKEEEKRTDLLKQLVSSNPNFGKPIYQVKRDINALGITAGQGNTGIPISKATKAALASDIPTKRRATGLNDVLFRTPSFDTVTNAPQIETKQLGESGLYANFYKGKRYNSNSEAVEARAKDMQRLYQAGRISDSGRIYTEPQLDLKTNLQRYGQAGNIGEEFNKGKETTPAPTVTQSKELSEQVAQTGKIPSKAEVLAARKQFLASLPNLTLPITNISSVAKKLLAS